MAILNCCPNCNSELIRKGGGDVLVSGQTIKYYDCENCNLRFRDSGRGLELVEEPFRYRNITKARRALVDMLRIDCQLLYVKGQASQIDEETQELAENIRRMKQ